MEQIVTANFTKLDYVKAEIQKLVDQALVYEVQKTMLERLAADGKEKAVESLGKVQEALNGNNESLAAWSKLYKDMEAAGEKLTPKKTELKDGPVIESIESRMNQKQQKGSSGSVA